MKEVPPNACARISSPDANGPQSRSRTKSSTAPNENRNGGGSSNGSGSSNGKAHYSHSHAVASQQGRDNSQDDDFFAASGSPVHHLPVRNMTVHSLSSPRTPTPTRKRATSLVQERGGAQLLDGSCSGASSSKPTGFSSFFGAHNDGRIKNLFTTTHNNLTTNTPTTTTVTAITPAILEQPFQAMRLAVSVSGSIQHSSPLSAPSSTSLMSISTGWTSPTPSGTNGGGRGSAGAATAIASGESMTSGSDSALSLSSNRKVMALHHQLQRSTLSSEASSSSITSSAESSLFGPNGNTTIIGHAKSSSSQWNPTLHSNSSKRFEVALNSSNTAFPQTFGGTSNSHGASGGSMVPLTPLHSHQHHHYQQQQQQKQSTSVWVQPTTGTTADPQPTMTALPGTGFFHSDSDSDSANLEQVQDGHSGVIMALPGPGLNSSVGSLNTAPSSSTNGRGANGTDRRGYSLGWHRLNSSMSALASQSLASRLYAHRPQFSSIGSTNWSVVRVVNTCHLLYLIPVTTITVGRLLTTETICDEQLFSWLTVQSFLFMSQIISACYILQRQTMSTRVTILDQRARVLLLVFMIWTVIGVGFLGADTHGADQTPTCVASEDPIYSLSFKIIAFHVSVIGFYLLPCSSFLLACILPSSLSSGLTRTATKPMIDKLGSIPMTEGLFGSDPEEATCAICLGDYAVDETIRFLPCQHHFHQECVDQWLLTDKSCPLCKHDIDKPLEAERAAHVNTRIQLQQQQIQQQQQQFQNAGSSSRSHDPEALTMYPNGFQVIVI